MALFGKPLTRKVLVTLLLSLLLIVPLTFISGLVNERQAREREVNREIARSFSASQTVAGPILVLPYIERWNETVQSETRNVPVVVARQRNSVVIHTPRELTASGPVSTSLKYRGIFKVPVYVWNGHLEGRFELSSPQASPAIHSQSVIEWGTPYISLGISDSRGFQGMPRLTVNGATLEFLPGTELNGIPQGIHAPFQLPTAEGANPGEHHRAQPLSLAFSLEASIQGSSRLSLVPLAKDNHFKLESAWPHPSFGGRFLPDPATQKVSPAGFNAEWRITALASQAIPQIRETVDGARKCAFADNAGVESYGDHGADCLDQVDVRFVEPVTAYSLTDRAIKYGFLFVALTFAAFFLFEVLKRLAIHPAQYLLVGLAQALFFLLVLSLSEHLSFTLAFAAATLACVGLIGYYLVFVLKSWQRGLAFSGLLVTLYGALYGILISEDNALMLGSLLLFLLLASAMVITRRVDWYGLGDGTARPAS